MMNTDIINRAIQLATGGISVIPVAPGGKNPAIPWKKYQQTPATTTEILDWYTRHPDWGLGVICGKVSGNLEMLELEGRAQHLENDICELAENSNLGELFSAVAYMGWSEESPSGGVHYFYRTEQPTAGNTQLAKTADGKILAETRGEGGFVVVAPTDGTHHQTRKPWTIRTNVTVPALTADQHEALWALFQSQNQHLPADPEPQHATASTDGLGGVRPGDDYETKTSWEQILTPHGWTPVFTTGNTTYWRRPDKRTGISATTGHATDRDRLYVFTTSTSFQPETPYTKFGAYTLLNHHGDHTAAAAALTAEGYGQPRRDTHILDQWTQTLQQENHEPTDRTQVYEQTDYGNMLRFADQNAGRLIYITELGKWAAWTGQCWTTTDGDSIAIETACNMIRDMPVDDKASIAWRKRSQSRAAIENVVKLASHKTGMYTTITNFDKNPYQLNTPAGIIDLCTGNITPPSPAALCLRSTTCPPIEQPTPVYDKFLDQTFTSDTQLIDYVQTIFGIALIGQVTEQIFPFFYGLGANGKSTLLELFKHILGTGATGYATVLPAEAFLANAANRHPAEIAKLAGARLAITSETEEGQKFAEARVKQLTGADTISARFMRQDWFDFTPSHTLIMVSNHEPQVAAGGEAFWRRIRKIPFNNIVPEAQRDRDLLDKLKIEAPGILWKTIQATVKYVNNGITTPSAVLAATNEYENEQDTVKMYIQECCSVSEPNTQTFAVKISEFRQQYETWCRINDYEPVGSKTLTQRVKTYGVKIHRGAQGVRYYDGIRIENYQTGLTEEVH